MKNAGLTLFLALLFSSRVVWAGDIPIQLQIMKPDAVQSDLKGPVKQITTVEYEMEKGKSVPGGKESRIYDTLGNILEEIAWDENGKFEERIVAEYDIHGNLTGKKTFSESGAVLWVHSFEFLPEKKQIIETVKNPEGQTGHKTVYQYDLDGFEKEVTDFDLQDKQTDNAVFVRDMNGKETEVVFYGPDNKKTSTTKVEWKADGVEKSMDFESYDKKFESQSSFVYEPLDKQGNWTKRTEYCKLKSKESGTVRVETMEEREIVYYP